MITKVVQKINAWYSSLFKKIEAEKQREEAPSYFNWLGGEEDDWSSMSGASSSSDYMIGDTIKDCCGCNFCDKGLTNEEDPYH